MLLLSHVINSPTLSSVNLITTSSVYRLFNISKQQKRRQDITSIIKSNITTTSLFSNLSSLSSSTSTTPQQQISTEESYSAKTGIKTAALLGGMLCFAIFYFLWKARSRLCRLSLFSSSGIVHIDRRRPSASKFDLDYWLKQVDLLEARDAERDREALSPYLDLPTEEPRDSQAATESWIFDTWRQWRLLQYRQQHQLLRSRSCSLSHSDSIPYRRRRHLLRRFVRRLLTPSHQRPSFLIEHSSSIIADMRPSLVNNTLIPPPETSDVQPRRVASWPRLKSTQHQNGSTMSALQIRLARKRLLKRTSRTT